MSKADKQYAVLGLGRFGESIAMELANNGYDVLAIDKDEALVQNISRYVRYSVRADVTDIEALKAVGLSNFDVAIISIGANMDSSIMATLLARELGVKYIVAKAQNEMHKKILKKIGADRVIFPEREMGERIANSLISGSILEYLEVSPDCSIVETEILPEWIGKNLKELDFRENYHVNIVALKRNNEITVKLNPQNAFEANDIVIVIGANEDIANIEKKRG